MALANRAPRRSEHSPILGGAAIGVTYFMDLLEKINRAFGTWYEGLFGATDDVRPRDILRAIFTALEENRKEGVDGRVYAPNLYTVDIAPDDDEEREYLLTFLVCKELETAVYRYCEQNRYAIRGALNFTIHEVGPRSASVVRTRRKFRVRSRFARITDANKDNQQVPRQHLAKDDTETVAASQPADNPTVAEAVPGEPLATLTVHPPDGAPYDVPITSTVLTIGRSSRAGNDLVLAADGLVSRRHARIELDSDDLFTVYDLSTTNGTRVNGERIDNHTLHSGDQIQLGATTITFEQHQRPDPLCREGAPATSVEPSVSYRVVLMDGDQAGVGLLLASDTMLGRGITNDIVLPDPSVAMRHARIRLSDTPSVEPLDAAHETTIDGRPAPPGIPVPIHNGCVLRLGAIRVRFEEVKR